MSPETNYANPVVLTPWGLPCALSLPPSLLNPYAEFCTYVLLGILRSGQIFNNVQCLRRLEPALLTLESEGQDPQPAKEETYLRLPEQSIPVVLLRQEIKTVKTGGGRMSFLRGSRRDKTLLRVGISAMAAAHCHKGSQKKK